MTFVAKDLTMGRLNALVKTLGGADVVDGILKKNIKVSLKYLTCKFPVWKTIRLGLHATGQAYYDAIENMPGMKMRYVPMIRARGSEDMYPGEQETINLALVTIEDLGLLAEKNPTYGDVCEAAGTFGLRLCPPEVGPALRLQYTDQPVGEVLRIGMKARPRYGTDSGPSTDIFSVENEGTERQSDFGMILGSVFGHLAHPGHPIHKYVFVHPDQH